MTQKAPHPSGLSLSTKFIGFVVFLELVLMVPGFYAGYHYLIGQKTAAFQERLSQQLELISRELQIQAANAGSFRINTSLLDRDFQFQILDDTNHVHWDSMQPKRIHTQILEPHPLLQKVRSSGSAQGAAEISTGINHEPFITLYKKSVEHFTIFAAAPIRIIRHSVLQEMEKAAAFASFFFGLSIILLVLFTRRLFKPVQRLTFATQKISGGDFDFELGSPSNDEIGILSDAFSTMAQRVRDLLHEEIQKVRIEKEVNTVALLQETFIPQKSIENPRFFIESYYESASETGGDYWGFFETESFLVFYVADATGHGLSSAMLTAAAKGAFSALQAIMKEKTNFIPQPADLLRYVNEAVVQAAHSDLGMTMFISVYHFADSTLHYSNAGHSPGWVIRKDKVESLRCLGPHLGNAGEFNTPENKSTTLEPGDTVFIYTDGILDALSVERETYGRNRLKEFFSKEFKTGKSLAEIRDATSADVHRFIGERPLRDDLTFALIKPRFPEGGNS